MDREKVPAPPPAPSMASNEAYELNWKEIGECLFIATRWWRTRIWVICLLKSSDFTTTTMATKTWPAKDTENSFWHRNMLYFAFHKSNLSRVSECKWWLNFLFKKTLSAKVLIRSNMCWECLVFLSAVRYFALDLYKSGLLTESCTYYLHWSELVWQWHRWYDPRVMSSPWMECVPSIIGISLIEYSQPARQRPRWKFAKLD